MGDFNKNTSVRPWTLNDRRVLAESSFVYSMNLFIRSSQSFRMTCEQYLQSLNYERNDKIQLQFNKQEYSIKNIHKLNKHENFKKL